MTGTPAPVTAPRISSATNTGQAVTTTDESGFSPTQVAAFGQAAKLAPVGTVAVSGGTAPMPTSTPSVISSQQGAQIVGQKTQQLSKLTAPTVVPTGNTGTVKIGDKTADGGTVVDPSYANKPTQTSVTLINPTTEQTITYNDAAINKDNIQQYLNSGYQVSEASGALPDWLSPTGTTGPQTDAQKAQADLADASNTLKSLSSNLSQFTVSDAQLQTQIAGITALWNAREADMQKVDDSRLAAVDTLGVRLGSRFAGGKGGAFGGIVSEEEAQGVQRIADLEGQKQAAISAAQTAAMTQNWSVYSKQVDLAQKAYEDKVTEVANLQKAAADQNKLIADQLNKAQTDYYTQVTKPIQDIATDAAKNGATQDQLDAIKNAPDVQSAITAAGSSLQNPPTGEIGDFMATNKYLASANLPQLTLKQYQNQQDQRKEAVAAASRAAPNAPQPTSTQITYGNYAPRLETADATIESLTPKITALPTLSFLLQEKLPSYLQTSDVQTYNQAKSNFISAVLRQESGAAISDSERSSYDQQYFPQPGDSSATVAQKAQNRQQLVDSYKNDAGPAYVPSVAVQQTQTEDASRQIIVQYGTSHPDQQAHIQDLAKTYSYSDIKQILGI